MKPTREQLEWAATRSDAGGWDCDPAAVARHALDLMDELVALRMHNAVERALREYAASVLEEMASVEYVGVTGWRAMLRARAEEERRAE